MTEYKGPFNEPIEEVMPMSSKVKELIEEGKVEEAAKFTAAYSKAWLQKANEGKLLNLSDFIGMNEIAIAASMTEKPKDGKQ